MSEIKLLPCPICGGEAELIEQKHREYASTYIVTCKGRCVCQYPYRNEERAVSDWNTRKPIDDMVEQLESNVIKSEGGLFFMATHGIGFVSKNKAIEIVRGGRE